MSGPRFEKRVGQRPPCERGAKVHFNSGAVDVDGTLITFHGVVVDLFLSEFIDQNPNTNREVWFVIVKYDITLPHHTEQQMHESAFAVYEDGEPFVATMDEEPIEGSDSDRLHFETGKVERGES